MAKMTATENSNVAEETPETKEDGVEQSNAVEEEQKLPYEVEDGRKTCTENQSKETDINDEDTDENKSILSKLFVHSQWLAVQSPYFKALFYSGMKETYSNEVVMKIYEDDLQAHLTLIEAMYKLDVLIDKDYHLVVQVLVLANKYDVRHVIKKCKYVLLSTAPSLDMCEYILQEIKHLSHMADMYDMLEKFLVKEFTPIDKTWTMEKFTGLSKAALRLLLESDSLGTQSENTIFVALMEWVRFNIPSQARNKCDLLDVVRFEFIEVDFLYDFVQEHLVATKMLGFTKHLLKGLAYHGFSQIRREQFKSKPKKRPFVADADPTFSWVIDDKLEEKLTKFPGVPVYSSIFWNQGYKMKLQLGYMEDLSKCNFYLAIFGLKGEGCLYASYRAKSSLFVSKTIQLKKTLYTASNRSWGYRSLECNKAQIRGKGYTIDIWVQIN
ncbi:kelch 28 [Paramuricea clavata]|uniref:Kelch 28 n=1 Tax=Paramuricea clavata TaxID=317549 RepID=A0A6S7KBF1_PARCT|nr:kelch 28 [Paramuricea clavata]